MDQSSHDPSNIIYLLLNRSTNQQSSTVERWQKAKGPGSTPGVGIYSCDDNNEYYHRHIYYCVGAHHQIFTNVYDIWITFELVWVSTKAVSKFALAGKLPH